MTIIWLRTNHAKGYCLRLVDICHLWHVDNRGSTPVRGGREQRMGGNADVVVVGAVQAQPPCEKNPTSGCIGSLAELLQPWFSPRLFGRGAVVAIGIQQSSRGR
jgi:hypothetical protein